MRYLTTAILVCVAATTLLHAQPLSPLQQAAITSGATGKEFWIAIPPNEINPFPTNALEIYVSSAFDTEVELYDASSDRTIKKPIAAGTAITLSAANGDLSWVSEIREYEKISRKGLRLAAEKPISVSVLNAKVTSSDAYLAVPVVLWDTSYIVTSYYDFKEFKPWAGGFTIVVGSDNTEVTVLLRGVG